MNHSFTGFEIDADAHDQEDTLPGDGPVLDEQLLSQYADLDAGDGDDALLPQILGMFLQHMPEYLDDLDKAQQKTAEDEIRFILHKMLGMSQNIGAMKLSQHLKQMEEAAQDSGWAMHEVELALLQAEYQAAAAALVSYVQELRP